MRAGWRKLHNEELHNLNSSPGIIRMIMSRRSARGSVVVKALCYKPEGRGFDTR
jgi:hypothetical protein